MRQSGRLVSAVAFALAASSAHGSGQLVQVEQIIRGQNLGACCHPGGCAETDPPVCAMLAGEWHGLGTTCEDANSDGVPDVCAAVARGACCTSEGCGQVTEEDCSSFGGFYGGDGTTCDDANGDGVADVCELDGACCRHGSGGCFTCDDAKCAFFGGYYAGDGTTCEDNDGDGVADVCSAPGACCIGTSSADRACLITDFFDCKFNLGGVFLGFFTACEQTTLYPIHTGPQSEWSHRIVTTSNCDSVRGAGAACAGGPYMIDPWATAQDGSSNCENFGAPSSCAIPAGFFGPGSDPFTGTVCFEGAPIGSITLPGFSGPLDFGDADTLVQRPADPFLGCDLPGGAPSSVNIMVVRLNLVSSAPITVTFGGGPTESWDTRVEVLSATDPPQPAGSLLTAVKTGFNGGTFDSTLAVCPRFVFTQVGSPGNIRTLDYCTTCNAAGIVMTTDDVGWMHEQSSSMELVNPVCTEFRPGVAETRADSAFDCNANAVRDSCDTPTGDMNGDSLVDLTDIWAILDCFRGPCGVEGLPCDDPAFGNPCCHLSDFEGDDDIDLQDMAVLLDAFSSQ